MKSSSGTNSFSNRNAATGFSFPRIVAHRGASGIAPENTIPALEKALALGVQEVEFDLWETADGKIVLCHDETLDQTTTGTGAIAERPWSYIRTLDAGVKFGPQWASTRIPLLEEAVHRIAGKAFMNIHVKEPGRNGIIIERIRSLADAAGVADQVYITGKSEVLSRARAMAPDIVRCSLEGQENGALQLRRAAEWGCRRIQFSCGCCTNQDIRSARDQGFIVNYFYSDDSAEARRLLGIGVMALLTNRPDRVTLEPQSPG